MKLELLEKTYNEQEFKDFIATLGVKIEEDRLRDDGLSSLEKKHIKAYKFLGKTARLSDKSILGCFAFEAKDKNIENKRVAFGDIIQTLARPYRLRHALVAIYHPKSVVWRLTYVSFTIKDGELLLNTNLKRSTYVLGENIAIKTAKEQIGALANVAITRLSLEEVFSVEKVSKAFFEDYKAIYFKICSTLEAQVGHFDNEKDIRFFTKKLLGRVVFLYFVQKKGWLGSKEVWGDGDKKFISNLYQEYKANDFYTDILRPIFFEALNTKRKNDYFKLLECKMPFLNGGLFTKDKFDERNIIIEDETIKTIIEMFNNYNFTIIEDTPHDSEVAIDPEMLGKVFEDLLEDRKEKGAFYTPREIVHYMCQQSIKEYLKSKPKDISKLNYIKQIKILDPAIGSGAFPMGMLHEIVQMRIELGDTTLLSDLKREVIENSIYGIDIEPSAVEIAKLRFWLSIVVDEETPTPLPNLFYKIMVGNSLLETINGFDPLAKDNTSLFDKDELLIDEIQELLHRFYRTHSNKQELQEEIDNKVDEILNKEIDKHQDELRSQVNNISILGFDKKQTELVQKLTEKIALTKEVKKRPTIELFFYKVYFAEVLNQGGFDIVIGNPPYVRHEKIKAIKERLKIEGYKSYNGTADLYIYFFEQGYRLLKENGILSYITSNKYTRAKYGKDFRKFLLENAKILEYIDFNGVKVFESATVDTSILSYQKAISEKSNFTYCDVDKSYKRGEDLEKFVTKKGFDYLQSDLSVDSFSFSSPQELAIKKRIEEVGIPLRDWDIEIYRGILTGFNEAFIIDGKTKDELIAKDHKSLEIIKPLLNGRDIKKYSYKFVDKWLLYIPWDFEIDNFIAIKEHLTKYKDKLSLRPEVKSNRYNWYALSRYGSDYIGEFEKDKIMWMELSDAQTFTIDINNFYINKTLYFMTGGDLKYLTSILNSKIILFYYHSISTSSGVGTTMWQKINIEKLPIPQISKEAQKPFEILVDYVLFAKENKMNIEASYFESVIDGLVYDLYFAEEMKKGDCFISDEVTKLIGEFDGEKIGEVYKVFKDNKTIQRGLIYSRIISVVEVINGAKK